MKKYLSKIIPVFIILGVFLYSPAGVIMDVSAAQNDDPGAKESSNCGLSGKHII